MSDTKAVEQRIAEIRARLEARTGGKWFVSEAEEEFTAVSVYMFSDDDSLSQYASHREWKCEHGCYEDSDRPSERDQYAEAVNTGHFIANAPSDMAWLLDQLSCIPARIEAAVQAEREACAGVAESDTMSPKRIGGFAYRREIAAAIRSRGETSNG